MRDREAAQTDKTCIQNLEFINNVHSPEQSRKGVLNKDELEQHDATLDDDHSSLTPSDVDSLELQETKLDSSESTKDADSGPFLASFLDSRSPTKTISCEEHKELMSALNDKWDCELDHAVRNSEDMLYEQAINVDHKKGILTDRTLKEELDRAREKEKAALRTEAKLREEFRQLKTMLNEEISKRESYERQLDFGETVIDGTSNATYKSPAVKDNIKGATTAIQKFCLNELSQVLDQSIEIAKDSVKDDKFSNNSFRKEIWISARKYQKKEDAKAKISLRDKEKSLDEENTMNLEESKQESRIQIEKFRKEHNNAIEKFYKDAERDREKLIADMKASFHDMMNNQNGKCLP